MRRYTGQRALYEAWSLSRSKPKRHGLLERLRPQLEKLHAVANAKLKSAVPPLVRPAAGSEAQVPREDHRQESREAVVQPPVPRLEPRPEVPVPVRAETSVQAKDGSPDAAGGVLERKETRPPKSKGKGSKNRPAGQNVRNVDEVLRKEPVETMTVITSPSLPFSDMPVVEEPRAEAKNAGTPAAELPKVEAPKVELPMLEPLKAEESKPAVEEAEPAPATMAASEAVKPVTHEPAEPIRSFAEEESPKPVEQPVLTPQVDVDTGAKPVRIGDRLKEFRTQRNEPFGAVKDTKPHAGLNFKPRPVQVIAGRMEISVPVKYVVPGLLAVLLIVFVLGRASVGTRQGGLQGNVTIKDKNPVADTTPVAPGNNVIVIASRTNSDQLTPLRDYFNKNGVPTGLVTYAKLREHLAKLSLSTAAVPKGDGYFLITTNTYNNPESSGTDGYKAKQEIIELGAKYQAPAGSASFAPSGLYGLKVK